MKSIMKRIASLGLAICLSLSIMATASAADTDIDIRDINLYEVMLTADGQVAWYYDAATGVVVADLDENGNIAWWETTLKTLWGDRYTPPETVVSQPVPETNHSILPETAPFGNDADPDSEPVAEFVPTITFNDVSKTYWGYNDISECAKLGIVAGFEDGSFRPEDNVTSVQFIVMLTRTFYVSKIAEISVPNGSAWYYANTKVAADVGISTDMKAIDDKPINRYEMALMLYNTMVANNKKATSAQKTDAISSIKDYKSIPTSPTNYRPAVQNCYGLGIITGMSDGSFQGGSNMTRAQACTVIMRMLKLINNYNPGDADNNQYDDGKTQDTDNNQQTTGTLANGQPATVENVQAILEEIKREYPTGTVWTAPGAANNNYYAAGTTNTTDKTRDIGVLNAKYKSSATAYASLQYGCGGWATMVSERIFGKTGAPGRQVTSISEMRPGDIVFNIDSNTGYLTHVAIVYKVGQINGQWCYSTCDGNFAGQVCWGINLKFTALSDKGITYYVYTRYPE